MRSAFRLLCLYALLCSPNIFASAGPDTKELNQALTNAWIELENITSCTSSGSQKSRCLKELDGKTIQYRSFGMGLNALIIHQVLKDQETEGKYIIRQSGFLIGPIDHYAYRVIFEEETRVISGIRKPTSASLRVFVHTVDNNQISSSNIELTKNGTWNKGNTSEWKYHWQNLNILHYALISLKAHLRNSN